MLEHKTIEPRFTYSDYVQWDGDECWELIDGVPFDMSPAPGRRQHKAVGDRFRQISTFLLGHACEVYPAPFDVRLPMEGQDDSSTETVVQPDLSVVCDPDKLDEAGCHGAPDWIVEVVSPRTEARDRVQKRDLYERHGVREYWIVHPTERTLTTYHLDPASGRFAPPTIEEAAGTARPQVFPDLEIGWQPVFGS